MVKEGLVRDIILKLETTHPNLYHGVTKKEIEEFIAKISWQNLNKKQFDYHMLRLFSKFKDSHTSWIVPYKYLDLSLCYIDDKVYLKRYGKYLEVIEINGCLAQEVVDRIGDLVNYESEYWKKSRVDFEIKNGYYLEVAGIVLDGNIVCKVLLEDGNVSEVCGKILTQEEFESVLQSQPQKKQTPLYEYKILDDTLYVIYRSCSNQKGYPFQKFVKDMAKEIKQENIKGYILDLRNNTGGDSRILEPLRLYFTKLNLPGVLLINNKTFSSAGMAVADFKKNLSSIVVGEPAGATTKNYGDSPRIYIDDYCFSCCTKFFDYSDLFGYEGAIMPDIFVKKQIEDFRNGTDPQLDCAMHEIERILSENEI